MAKPRLYGDDLKAKQNVLAILIYVLTMSMKLLHPFMPFITEELYLNLPGHEETIMLSAWPVANAEYDFPAEEKAAESLMELIRSIRNLRVEMNVPAAKRVEMFIVTDEKHLSYATQAIDYFMKLAGASEVHVQTSKDGIPADSVSTVSKFAESFMPLSQLIDIAKEIERISRECARMQGEVARAQGKLNNAGFVAKAPQHVIEEERKKLAAAIEMFEKLNNRLNELNKLKS